MADRKTKSKKPVAKAAQTSTRKPARVRSPAAAPSSASTAIATVLLLRTCGPNGEAYGDFRWPLEEGREVVAPDWRPDQSCGHGLHGLLWGEGDPNEAWHWEAGAKWLVVEALASDVVDIGRTCKVPRCRIVHVGDQKTATEFIAARGPGGKAIVGGTATAGDRGTATAGDRGTICILWWTGSKFRRAIGEVGEDGIEANVAYVVRDGKLARKEAAP